MAPANNPWNDHKNEQARIQKEVEQTIEILTNPQFEVIKKTYPPREERKWPAERLEILKHGDF